MNGYVLTEAIRQKMRESSRKRWMDQSQRDRMSKLRTVAIPMREVKRLYQQGWSMRKIGDRFGVNADTIHRRMRQHGIPARKKGTAGHHWDDEHHNWKGNHAGYQALHRRLHRRRGMPMHCEVCGTSDPAKTYDWANLTGNYEDIDDYKRMCRSCHRRYDHKRRKHNG